MESQFMQVIIALESKFIYPIELGIFIQQEDKKSLENGLWFRHNLWKDELKIQNTRHSNEPFLKKRFKMTTLKRQKLKVIAGNPPTLLPLGFKVAVKNVIFSIFQKFLKTIPLAFW